MRKNRFYYCFGLIYNHISGSMPTRRSASFNPEVNRPVAGENIRILCIDDEEEIRAAMKAVFDSQGWAGDFAQEVEEGLKIAEHTKPDIVIMDYHMPKIDGITGTKMLRKLMPETPIIIFTIEDNQEIADKFLEAGASDFAIKPLRAPDIIARIRLHIRMIRKEPEGAKNNWYYVEKGISAMTMELITDFMKKNDDVTVEEIAEGTGLAYQTVYRYIQYMSEKGTVISEQSYGKIGRPKRRFSLKRETE